MDLVSILAKRWRRGYYLKCSFFIGPIILYRMQDKINARVLLFITIMKIIFNKLEKRRGDRIRAKEKIKMHTVKCLPL